MGQRRLFQRPAARGGRLDYRHARAAPLPPPVRERAALGRTLLRRGPGHDRAGITRRSRARGLSRGDRVLEPHARRAHRVRAAARADLRRDGGGGAGGGQRGARHRRRARGGAPRAGVRRARLGADRGVTRNATAALLGIGVPVLVVLAIQLVPYGRDHTPPPSGRRVVWDSARTEELARRACFDCHSNETRWPWYASIAPISWRIQTDVNLARARLDFTAFDSASAKAAEAAAEAAETVPSRDRPLQDYDLMHDDARRIDAAKRGPAAGLAPPVAPVPGA